MAKCLITYWGAVGLRDGYAGRYDPPVDKVNHPLELGAWEGGYADGRRDRKADDIDPDRVAMLYREVALLRKRVETLESRRNSEDGASDGN